MQQKHLSVIGIAGVVAEGDYSDILLFWRAESTTMSADDCYGTNATWSAEVDYGTTEIVEAAAKVGTYGVHVAAGETSKQSGYKLVVDTEDVVVTSAGRIGFWVKINTWVNFSGLFAVSDSGDPIKFVMTILSDDEVRASYGGTLLASTSANLSTATWYFIEVAYDASIGDGEDYMEVFVDGSSVASSSALTLAPFTPTFVRVGNPIARSNYSWYIDHFMISNDKTRNLYALRNTTACPN